MRHAARRAIHDGGDDVAPAASHEYDEHRDHRAEAALEPARRADAEKCPHQEAEIEAADVDDEPFQDVDVATQVRPAHSARLVEMGVRPLQALAPAPLQPMAARPADSSTVRIDRVARRRFPMPATWATIRFRDV